MPAPAGNVVRPALGYSIAHPVAGAPNACRCGYAISLRRLRFYGKAVKFEPARDNVERRAVIEAQQTGETRISRRNSLCADTLAQQVAPGLIAPRGVHLIPFARFFYSVQRSKV